MKIALVGCGYIAGVHANTLARVAPEVKIIAVSRTQEKARANQGRLHAREAIAPYDAAFARADIDAVILCTAHHAHVEPAVAALETGKHVYLEKPVARTVAEAEPVVRAAAARPKQTLMIGEQYHLAPPVLSALQMIRDGRIGTVRSIVANCLYCVRAEAEWRHSRETMGGGALIDGGIHEIHVMRMLGGEIAGVYAVEPAGKWNTQMEGEETVQMNLRFVSGATAVFSFSWGHHGDPGDPEFLVLGSEGSLTINMRGRHNVFARGMGLPTRHIPTTGRFEQFDVMNQLGYNAGILAFIDAIHSGNAPQPGIEEGLRDLRVIEAAYRSLKSGREEAVEAVGGGAGLVSPQRHRDTEGK